MDLVSIVIPVYKVPEKYLTKCIESVLSQTYSNIEILIPTNKEDNNSIEILKRYNDERIKIIYENTSLSNARIVGQKKASGKYLLFVDGDDWIECNCIKELVDNIGDCDILCSCNMRDYNGKIFKLDFSKKFEDNKIYQSKEELHYMICELLDYNSGNASVNCKLFNLNFLKVNNLYHLEMLKQGCEGIEFNIRAFSKAKKIKFINKYYYHYMYNETSISSTSTEKNTKMTLLGMSEIKKYLLTLDNNDDYMSMFNNRLLYFICTTIISCYFHPLNKDKYAIKKEKLKQFMKNDLIKDAMVTFNTKGLDKKRKILLFLLKNKLYFILFLIGKIRFLQKKYKLVNSN